MKKQYNLYKTAKKTIKENNLIEQKSKRLYDVSIIDDLHLTDTEKELIKADIVKYHIWMDKVDNFFIPASPEFINGKTKWAVHKVYSEDGKQLYFIVQLIAIKLVKKIHNSWTGTDEIVNSIDYDSGWTDSETDIII